MEASLFADAESGPAAVMRIFHPFGDQAISGSGFIAQPVMGLVAHQQTVGQLGDTVHLHAGGISRANALENIRVEAVKGALAIKTHSAAFGGIRVDVIKVLKVGGVLEVAEGMVAVAAGYLGVASHAEEQGHKGQ